MRVQPSLLFAFLFLIGPVQAAEDWTEFRGPGGQGVADARNVPTRWTKEEGVKWRKEIPGKGWSSPIVLNGKIYLTSAIPRSDQPNDQDLTAICLDARTGEIVWSKLIWEQDSERSGGDIHNKNSHASPTPITDGKHLFVHFGTAGTAALTLDGEILWKKDEIRYSPVHGNGGSPVLVDSRLVFSCDGTDRQEIVALDSKSGDLVWSTPRTVDYPRHFSFSTPLLLEHEGRRQIVSIGSGCVMSLDPQSGKELWRVNHDGYSVIPKPLYGHGLVYICTGYNSPVLMAIRPDGTGDVTETHVAWKAEKAIPHSPSLILHDNLIFSMSDNGIASCFDATTGEQIWQKRVGGNFSASPVLVEGNIFWTSEEGLTTVLKADRNYEEVSKNDLEERTLSSIAVVEGALLLRTENALYRIER